MSVSNLLIATFLLTLPIAIYNRLKGLKKSFNSLGHRFPVRSTIFTIAITLFLIFFSSILTSIQLDLVYSMWTERMLAIGMAILWFTITPVSYYLAAKLVHRFELIFTDRAKS